MRRVPCSLVYLIELGVHSVGEVHQGLLPILESWILTVVLGFRAV